MNKWQDNGGKGLVCGWELVSGKLILYVNKVSYDDVICILYSF